MFHDGWHLVSPTSSLPMESEDSGCDHLAVLVVAIFHLGIGHEKVFVHHSKTGDHKNGDSLRSMKSNDNLPMPFHTACKDCVGG